MKTNNLLSITALPALALLLIASLGVGCSGCGGGEADTTGDAAASMNDATSGSEGHSGEGGGEDHSGTAGHEGHDHGIGGTTAASTVDPWARTYDTPQAERTGTVENLNGLRATLVAELESVRARLKDGSRSADERKADTQRAAELAQGLERLDRTIKVITEANDVTWSQVRDSEMKAASEFREWMSKYGMPS